ncbi:MAG: pitrilysin family protein [Bacteroidota bacterium]
MIAFERAVLHNGLTVLAHEDDSTPLVAVNILYNVGARNESPDKTGFAHLFEHLMFGGSVNAPEYDEPLQWAGGECNAFTNNDITNYYDILPAGNLETAFWLESDRMENLNINDQTLEVQRKVVVEEFKENYLNQPYGDAWHQLSKLAFKQHPYRWPTIGLTPQHIEEATLDEVRTFFEEYYCPNNAILVVAGNVKAERVFDLAHEWFSSIPKGEKPNRPIPVENEQTEFHKVEIEADVPLDAVLMGFHIPARIERDYYICDLLSDLLANGHSSRFRQRLVKDKKIFTDLDAYITGSIDPGLFVIDGKPSEGVSIEQAEAAIWEELNLLRDELIGTFDMKKLKNKVESTLCFSEASILTKAINLAFFELLGDANRINQEPAIYQSITADDMQRVARQVFRKENCSEVVYRIKAKAIV